MLKKNVFDVERIDFFVGKDDPLDTLFSNSSFLGTHLSHITRSACNHFLLCWVAVKFFLKF
jgi:hypothetical protein